MGLRKLGPSRVMRALSGGLEGASDAVSLQQLLSGEEAFPVQPDSPAGGTPEDPFAVSIGAGEEGDDDEFIRFIMKMINRGKTPDGS